MSREVREFFYVDVDRVRSLLAQLQGGVVDAIKSETTNSLEGGAQAAILGVGGHGGYTRQSRQEESRSQQDLTFVAFEETANEENLITELDATFADPNAWTRGDVHAALTEGQLIRVTCDVQVLDGGLFGERVERFKRMAKALVTMTDALPAVNNPKQEAKMLVAAIDKQMGIPSAKIDAISEFVQAFVGDSISLRALPCGRENLEYGFSGALLGRKEYILEERENLFSRYGNVASRWTTVMQVAAIPSHPTLAIDVSTPMPEVDSLRADGDISRAGMERIASDFLGLMESIGLVEGPRWPSISVTPLGIYRSVPSEEPQ